MPRNVMRTMVRGSRAGRAVCCAPDQNHTRQYHVFVPFFGIQAATITSTAQLARLGKAKVIPFTHYRRADNSGYVVKIYPPLENFPLGDEHQDAARINEFIEARVPVCPVLYL